MNKIIFSLVLICGSLLFTSCEDDLVVGSVNQSSYNNIGKLEASLKDKNSGLSDKNIENFSQHNLCLCKPDKSSNERS